MLWWKTRVHGSAQQTLRKKAHGYGRTELRSAGTLAGQTTWGTRTVEVFYHGFSNGKWADGSCNRWVGASLARGMQGRTPSPTALIVTVHSDGACSPTEIVLDGLSSSIQGLANPLIFPQVARA